MKGSHDAKITSFIAILAFLVIGISKGNNFKAELWNAITTAVSITLLLRFIFMKWIWKFLPWLQKLHGVPLIEGRWNGTYSSTWVEDSTSIPATGPVEVVITQPNILTYKVTQKTAESMSHSFGETIETLEDGSIYLNFSFKNKPNATVRNRSQINYGAAQYLLEKNLSALTLNGNYFTDRKSTGSVSISLKVS